MERQFFFVRNLITRGIHSRILECNAIQKQKVLTNSFKDPPNRKDLSRSLSAKGGEVKTPNLAPLGKEDPRAYDLD